MKIKISVLKKCLSSVGIDVSTLSDIQITEMIKQMLDVSREIKFNIERLPFLYRFKNEVVELCVHNIEKSVNDICLEENLFTYFNRKKEKENLESVFVRWMFNSIAQNAFDFVYFLPTNETFIDMNDMYFYVDKCMKIIKKDIIMDEYMPILEKMRINVITNYRIILEKAKNDDKLKPHLSNIPTCTEIQIERLKSLYFSLTDLTDFDKNVDKILNRYHFMGGLNNSLSTPPAVMDATKSLNPPMKSHELFGTPLNTCSPTFCSPFPDEKLVFNSSGSFFHFENYKEDTVYFANPPFDENICDNMAEKLLSDLEKKEFALIVIIPVWDTDQQKKYKMKDYGLVFHGYRKLVNSRFFKSDTVLDKDTYPFYNYFTNKVYPSSTTHFINLGKKIDTDYLLTYWRGKLHQNWSGEVVTDMSKALLKARKEA
jgi:hypothetical protein